MQTGFSKRALGLVLLSLIFFTGRLSAADHFVDVLNSSFSPSSLQINVGDRVIWTNQDDDDDSHSATSNNGAWSGGLMIGFGDQFQFTFTSVGTFPYYDLFDGFSGTITVVSVTNSEISLSAPQIVSGQFQFTVSGLVTGKTNLVQASTNLVDWTSVRTNVATSSTSVFTNTQSASVSPRFFRVIQLP